REIGHQILEEFLKLFFTLFERSKIGSECFLGTERFARTIRFDRPVIDAATKIVEIKTEFAEKIDKFRAREPLQFAAGFDSKLLQFALALLADSPDFADWQILHELGRLFRLHLESATWFVYFARDFRNQFVGTNSRCSCQLQF